MTDDAQKVLADTKATIATLGTDTQKVVSWYKSHQFYAGAASLAVLEAVGWVLYHVLK